jgi:hypothetical protein
MGGEPPNNTPDDASSTPIAIIATTAIATTTLDVTTITTTTDTANTTHQDYNKKVMLL